MSIAAETPPGGRELCKQHSVLSSYVNRLGTQHLALGKLCLRQGHCNRSTSRRGTSMAKSRPGPDPRFLQDCVALLAMSAVNVARAVSAGIEHDDHHYRRGREAIVADAGLHRGKGCCRQPSAGSLSRPTPRPGTQISRQCACRRRALVWHCLRSGRLSDHQAAGCSQ